MPIACSVNTDKWDLRIFQPFTDSMLSAAVFGTGQLFLFSLFFCFRPLTFSSIQEAESRSLHYMKNIRNNCNSLTLGGVEARIQC